MKKLVNIDPEAIEEVLARGVDTVIGLDHLRERMLAGECLRIKFGIDPTSPHMHLGHTVPLRKLRQFQDLGHQAVLIIGDATAMIGDPTGRSEERKKITKEEVGENQKTYIEQASKIIDIDATEIHHNGEWFIPMTGQEFLGLTSLVTFQQVMQRDDFKKRIDDPEHPLSVLEITYPIMQGYDSVMVKSDVEIGGADQLLNLHMGRRLQRRFDQHEQDLLTVPLLEGTDGVRKMSKSFGNAIPLESAPEDMFGLVMTISDDMIVRYFTLLTDCSMEEVQSEEHALQEGKNPRDSKANLAWNLVRMYHGIDAANDARGSFDSRFRDGDMPEIISEFRSVSSSMSIVDVMVATQAASSKGEARRLIEQGGVKLAGSVIIDPDVVVYPRKEEAILQKGKRFFIKLLP
ncbi:MAG: tyrosine--tRNA ligase [Patescibacteria group bacterium]|jgi:tyrosyl-tRNA synthetase